MFLNKAGKFLSKREAQTGDTAILLTVLILASVLSLALLLTGVVIKDLRLSFNFKNSAKVFYAADAAAEKCVYGARKAAGNCQNVGGVETVSFSNGAQATATRTSASVIDAVGSLGVVQRAIKVQGAFATGVSLVASPNTGIVDTTVSGITITGSGFVNGATVKLRRTGYADVLPSTPFTFVSATKLQNGAFNLTGAATGAWDLVVTNPNGLAIVATGGFGVSSFSVSSITPNSGLVDSTVSISSVNGSGFQNGATVKLSKAGSSDILASTPFTFVSGNLLSNGAFNLTGAATGAWDVVVINPGGASGLLIGGFTVALYTPGNDSYAKLLLHADGTGATFIDSSNPAKTVTANGNVTQSATQSKFGGKSAYFDGIGDYLRVPDSSDWNFGTGDFTIDLWTRFNSTSGCQMLVNQGTSLSSYFQLDYCSGNWNFEVHSSGGNVNVSAPYFLNTDTWYHLALVKRSGTAYIYINGNLANSGSSPIIDNWSANLLIGVNFYGFLGGTYDYFNGYMDEIRISKGIARWTANFTPPTAPYGP